MIHFQFQVTTEKMLESLSNRRKKVPIIVVVVGDRTIKINRSKVDVHFQNCLRSVCDYKSQTGLSWSYHQSRVVAPPVVRDCVSSSRTISSSARHKLFRRVVRPIGDASNDLHLQSLVTIGCTCKRAITYDWRRWKVLPIVGLVVAINDQSYHQSWPPETGHATNRKYT